MSDQPLLCDEPVLTGGKRPTEYDEDVKRAAVEKLMPEIIRWMGNDYNESERENTVEDLLGVVNGWRDGYELAKRLEQRKYWSPDAELVEILNNTWSYLSNACAEMTAKWLPLSGLQPAHKIGDQVTVTQYTDREKTATGTIYKIDNKFGKYCIRVPEWGHVAEGIMGTQGSIFTWEEVDVANPAPGA